MRITILAPCIIIFFSLALNAMEESNEESHTALSSSSINTVVDDTQKTQIFFGTLETIPFLIKNGASIAHHDSRGYSVIDHFIFERKFLEAACALEHADEKAANEAISKKTSYLFTDPYNHVLEFSDNDEIQIHKILYEKSVVIQEGVLGHFPRILTIQDWIALF